MCKMGFFEWCQAGQVGFAYFMQVPKNMCWKCLQCIVKTWTEALSPDSSESELHILKSAWDSSLSSIRGAEVVVFETLVALGLLPMGSLWKSMGRAG